LTGIRDYSTTAASNTTVGGISTAEGMNPSGVNDAIRAFMADMAAFAALISWGTSSGTVGGTVDAITLTLSPALTAYAVNQRFLVKAAGANTSTTPTLNVSGLGAKTIKLPGGGAVAASQWTTNGMLLLAYDGTDLILLTPSVINTALFAALASANTFTATQTITSTDAGATEGPILDLHRDSASPAASDLISALYFSGESSTSAKRQYAKILATILDATNASEDADLRLQTIVAGTLATRATLGQGLLMAGASGGDPGGGKINASDYQKNGAALPLSKQFVSSDFAITSNSTQTLAHSLGTTPLLYQMFLVCVNADGGYEVGDIVPVNASPDFDGATSCGFSITVDATNVNVRCGSAQRVQNEGSTASAVLTLGDWNARVHAWA
jgi:hypothetical protein